MQQQNEKIGRNSQKFVPISYKLGMRLRSAFSVPLIMGFVLATLRRTGWEFLRRRDGPRSPRRTQHEQIRDGFIRQGHGELEENLGDFGRVSNLIELD